MLKRLLLLFPHTNRRKTVYIFDFIDPTLHNKPFLQQVFWYFSVNDVWYPGSILIFPQQIYLQDVLTVADIRAHSFDIVGSDKAKTKLRIDCYRKREARFGTFIFEKFKKYGIKVDVVATFEACSHFNFCSAFMIPQNL